MNMAKIFISSVAFSLVFVGCASKNDSVRKAQEQTKALAEPQWNENDTKFLTEMADARLMDFEEGKLVSQRGTNKAIRQYGKLMMEDQTNLLGELKAVAQKVHVVLPEKISESKNSGLQDLQKQKAKKLDQKFISMITIDHKRDVKAFREAKSEGEGFSPEVKAFAAKHLALIESHLEKIEAIEKAQK